MKYGLYQIIQKYYRFHLHVIEVALTIVNLVSILQYFLEKSNNSSKSAVKLLFTDWRLLL